MSRLLVLLSALFLSMPTMALEIVTTIRPLALIAQEISGQPVKHIIPTGVSLHDYHARPADHAKMANAGVILWLGPEFEPQFERQIARNKNGIVIDTSRVPNLFLLKNRLADGANGKGADMHFWLDYRNAIAIADSLSHTLAQQDPTNAQTYKSRASTFKRNLVGMAKKQKDSIEDPRFVPYVATHDGYRYLESMVNVRFRGAMSAGHHSHSSPTRVVKMRRDIQTNGITCLFAEPNFDKKFAASMFPNKDYKVAEIDDMFAKHNSYADGFSRTLKQMNYCLSRH